MPGSMLCEITYSLLMLQFLWTLWCEPVDQDFFFFFLLLYHFIHDKVSCITLFLIYFSNFYVQSCTCCSFLCHTYFEAKALAGVFPVSHQEFSHLQCHQRPSLVTTHALAKVGSPYRLPTHPPADEDFNDRLRDADLVYKFLWTVDLPFLMMYQSCLESVSFIWLFSLWVDWTFFFSDTPRTLVFVSPVNWSQSQLS